MTSSGPASPAAPASRPLTGPFGGRALRIGRVLGIEIGLDVSWLFILALVTVGLAGSLGAQHEGWGPLPVWGASLLTALVFFASILLHELGHSFVAQRFGVSVRSITLFLFGGLAGLAGRPRTPRAEFWIGIAGPLVSLALGGLFLALARTLPTESESLPVEVGRSVLGWLGTVNLVLAAFNLIPGYPLDGGHLLRAAVWAVTGDERRGTRVASVAGTAFAVFLIAVGAVNVLLFGALGGFWLVLIGWFLKRAAQGSAMQEVLEERLGAVPVRDAMTGRCPVTSGDTTVAELVAGPILHQGRRSFCVVDHGRLTGLVTLTDISAVPAEERAATRVEDIRVPREALVTLPEDASLWEAMKLMDDHEVNQLPVVDGEHLAGLLTREHLMRVVRNQIELGGARAGAAP